MDDESGDDDNKRSVIFNDEMVGGRERVTTDEERVLRVGWSASKHRLRLQNVAWISRHSALLEDRV